MPTKYERRQGATILWLLDLIEEFLTLNEMDNDGNSFGWLSSKDRTMVQRLRDGGDITTTRMDDVLAFIKCPGNHRTATREGLVSMKALKPLIIEPKELS